jgi:predicted NAD/FAD-binding protein
MKIAIVGTGIAGMTAARILSRRNDITVFESGSYIGGHTNTIRVNEGARELAVDTGFIVFNETTYPNLCRLFDELGVQSRDSDMSFSVHCDKTGIEYNGTDFNALFAQRRNLVSPRFWGMLAEIVRFNREAPEQLAAGMDDSISVEDYVSRRAIRRPLSRAPGSFSLVLRRAALPAVSHALRHRVSPQPPDASGEWTSPVEDRRRRIESVRGTAGGAVP